jgi:hypothetical protein
METKLEQIAVKLRTNCRRARCGKSARHVLWEPGAGDRLRRPGGRGEILVPCDHRCRTQAHPFRSICGRRKRTPNHSGRPASRRPLANVARSSVRRNGAKSLRLEGPRSGADSSARAMPLCAGSSRAAKAGRRPVPRGPIDVAEQSRSGEGSYLSARSPTPI